MHGYIGLEGPLLDRVRLELVSSSGPSVWLSKNTANFQALWLAYKRVKNRYCDLIRSEEGNSFGFVHEKKYFLSGKCEFVKIRSHTKKAAYGKATLWGSLNKED